MDGGQTNERDTISGLLSELFGGFNLGLGLGDEQDGADAARKRRAAQDAPITARLNSDPAHTRDHPDIFPMLAQGAPGGADPAPAPRPLPDPSVGAMPPRLAQMVAARQGASAGQPGPAPAGPQPQPQQPMQLPGGPVAPQPQPQRGGDVDFQGFLNKAVPDPNFMQRLGAGFAATQGASGILPALGRMFGTMDNAGPAAAVQRAKLGSTMKALVQAGASPEEAMAAAMDPKAMEAILPTLMPYARQKSQLEAEKQRAEVEKMRFEARRPVEIGVDGMGQKVFAVLDPKTGRHVNAMTGESLSGGAASGAPTPTGEDYLATQPTEVAARLRKIRTGEAQLPKGLSARSGINARLANGIYAYDENYNEQRFPVRLAFTKGGQEAQQIKAIGTFPEHLSNMARAIDAMSNTSWRTANRARNAFAAEFGSDAALEKFAEDRTALIGEAARVFKGGTPGIFDEKEWVDRFNPNMSKETLRSNLKELTSLVRGRLDALKDQWSATYPEDIPPPSNLQNAENKLNHSHELVSKMMGVREGEAQKDQAPAILGEPAQEAAPVSLAAPRAPGIDTTPNPFTPDARAVPSAPPSPPPTLVGAPPPAEAPGQAPAGPQIAPAAPPEAPTGGGPAILGGQQPEQRALTPPAGGVEALPLAASPSQINAIPVGAYFRTPTGDVFERIQPYPGFRKVMGGEGAPQLPGQGGAAPQSGEKQAMLPGGVAAPTIGKVEFARGPNGVPIPHRFAGGDPADPANWRALNPEQGAFA